MRTIFKYPIATTDVQTINIPHGSQILCVQVQHGNAQIWALVDTNEGMQTTHTIVTVGTGHKLPSDIGATNYLGTYQLQGGALVFHVFIQ